jgi:hypothetical protein
MDSLIAAAAGALAVGDVLGALKRVALRDDPPALALRGIAMAQLGDFPRAKLLLRTAASGFGPREAVPRARCVIAEAEIALVTRDLAWGASALEAARRTLEARGDTTNAAHARNLQIRRCLLIGRLDDAADRLGTIDAARLPPASRVTHELAAAGLATRRLRIKDARAALARATTAASLAGIGALTAEVESAIRLLDQPAARLVTRAGETLLRLDDIEALLASDLLVVDACRRLVRHRGGIVALTRRPVLFVLVRTLAEAWPGDVTRAELIARSFRGRNADESHRARLRVEVGRLRRELRNVADIVATAGGFALIPTGARDVAVLAPQVEGPHAEVLALLDDGEAWSSSSLAIALRSSARTVQRALEVLAETGRARSFGRGATQRWIATTALGVPTTLLLPGPLPGA